MEIASILSLKMNRVLVACGMLALACAACATTFAGREIRGHVREAAAGQPLANVTVTIEELRSSWIPRSI